MNQGRGLERVAGSFPAQVAGGQGAQFVVHLQIGIQRRELDEPGVEQPHCLPLAKAADAAFVAIALDHTPRETVQEALEHLHLHKAHVAGCVITDAPA